jgi:hypothetical protein
MLRGRLVLAVGLAFFIATADSLAAPFFWNLPSNFTADTITSTMPRANEWWLGKGAVRASAARVRVGGSYGRQKRPVLDLWYGSLV